VRSYDVVLDDKRWHFLPVQVVGEEFGYLGGELWPPAPDARYRFEWNHFDVGGCDYPEQIGSTELYVCGDGYATQSGSTLSGVIAGTVILVDGNRRLTCGGSHRFTFLPEAR
jgi:hypothetical protein